MKQWEKYYSDLRKTGLNIFFYKQFIRPMILHLKGDKCEVCGSTEHIDCHKTDYENMNIHTIKVLCRSCHRKSKAIKPLSETYTNPEETFPPAKEPERRL